MSRTRRWAQLLVAMDLCLLLLGLGATVAVAESYLSVSAGIGWAF